MHAFVPFDVSYSQLFLSAAKDLQEIFVASIKGSQASLLVSACNTVLLSYGVSCYRSNTSCQV